VAHRRRDTRAAPASFPSAFRPVVPVAWELPPVEQRRSARECQPMAVQLGRREGRLVEQRREAVRPADRRAKPRCFRRMDRFAAPANSRSRKRRPKRPSSSKRSIALAISSKVTFLDRSCAPQRSPPEGNPLNSTAPQPQCCLGATLNDDFSQHKRWVCAECNGLKEVEGERAMEGHLPLGDEHCRPAEAGSLGPKS
jgi:hypothetical protein